MHTLKLRDFPNISMKCSAYYATRHKANGIFCCVNYSIAISYECEKRKVHINKTSVPELPKNVEIIILDGIIRFAHKILTKNTD